MSESDRPPERKSERPPSLTREHMLSMPDRDEVISHPAYEKLEQVVEIFLAPTTHALSFDGSSDEEIIDGAREERQNAQYLSEFLFRVRKGGIPLRTLVMNFPANMVKTMILERICNWFEMQLRPLGQLEGVLKSVVDERLVTANEILAAARSEAFSKFVQERVSASGTHMIKAVYATMPPAAATPAAPEPAPVPAAFALDDDDDEKTVVVRNPALPPQPFEPAPSAQGALDAPERNPALAATVPDLGNVTTDSSIPVPQAVVPPAEPASRPPSKRPRGVPPPPPSSRGIFPPKRKETLHGMAAVTPEEAARARRIPSPPGVATRDLFGESASPDPSRPGRYAKVERGGALLDTALLKTIAAAPNGAPVETEAPRPPMASEPLLGIPEKLNSLKLPVVTHINADVDWARCPLLFNGEIHTIGTDAACDIVLPESYRDRVRGIHAEIKIEGGQIYIRGVKSALKIHGQNRPVLTEWRAISKDEAFYIGPEESDKTPCLLAEDGFEFARAQLETYLRDRYNQLLEANCAAIFNLLHAKSSTGSGEKKDLAREAERVAAETTEKMERFLAAAKAKNVQFATNTELNGLKYAAAKPMIDHIQNTVSRYAKVVGEETLRYVEANADSITGEIDNLFPLKIEEAKKAIERINNLLDFAEKHKLPIISEEDQKVKIEQQLKPAREFLANFRAKKAAQQKIIDDAERAKVEAFSRPLETHNRLLAGLQQQYNGRFHYAVDNELLDENTIIKHVGPAIVVFDAFGNRKFYPILSDAVTIGHHGANTIELEQIVDSKRGTRNFMARVDYDEKTGKFVYTWIDGKLEYAEPGWNISSPRISLDYEQKLIVGRYNLMIEGGHAYTEKALKAEVAREVGELIEVIFDQDNTTQEQNDKAWETIKTFHSLGLIDKNALDARMIMEMAKMWETVGSWNTSRPDDWELKDLQKKEDGKGKLYRETPFQDAHYLRTIKALLDDTGGFLPKSMITQEMVDAQAWRRVRAYAALDNEARKPDTTTLKIMRKVNPGSARVVDEDNRRATARYKADTGAVQIARLVEFGLVTMKDLRAQDWIGEDYMGEIARIVKIRELISLFQHGGAGINALTTIGKLGFGIRMREFFSVEEINIANQNIEVSVTPDSLLEDYIKKLAVFIGRKAFRNALDKEDVRAEVKILQMLMGAGLLRESDLIIEEFSFNLEKVKEALGEIMFNADETTKDERRNEQRRQKNLAAKVLFKETMHRKRMDLLAEGAKVTTAINEVRLTARLEILLDVAHIINNQDVANEMDAQQVTTEAIHIDMPLDPNDLPERMLGITGHRRLLTWKEVERVYKAVALDLAKDTLQKIKKGDDRSYNALLLKQGFAAGAFTESDLNTSVAEIEAEIEKERRDLQLLKYRRKHLDRFNVYMSAPFDDLDFLDQVKRDAGENEEEKQVVNELLDSVCWQKLGLALEKIQAGEDVAYMKLIVSQIRESGYQIKEGFTPEQLALLQ